MADQEPSAFEKAAQAEHDARTLERDLTSLLNHYSQENQSNTPDFILATFLLGCLDAWNASVQRREQWYGREHVEPGSVSFGGSGPVPVDPRWGKP